MIRKETTTAVVLAAGFLLGGASQVWAQGIDHDDFPGTRGRPSTVLQQMQRSRTLTGPTLERPTGSTEVRRPPGFFEPGAAPAITTPTTSPGVEAPLVPQTPGVSIERVPEFPKPEDPGAEDAAKPAQERAPAEAAKPRAAPKAGAAASALPAAPKGPGAATGAKTPPASPGAAATAGSPPAVTKPPVAPTAEGTAISVQPSEPLPTPSPPEGIPLQQ